jgi:hypothetical protein
MPTTQINTWGDSIFLALSNALNLFLLAIPLVIGALLILLVGWILSSIAARAVSAALRRVGVDRAYAEHSQSTYGQGAAASWQPSTVAGEVVKWLIRLVFLVAAANTLGLSQVSELLNQILLWIPNLIVAAIVLLVAPLLGKFVRGVIEAGAGEMGFGNAPLLGRLAQYAIIAFAAIIAINQIGIAANLVNTLFIGIVGAVALAFGLAFGLGGRDVAARMTEQWYASSQQAATRVQAAAKQAAGPGATTGAKKPGDETAKVYRPAPARSEP